MGARNGVAVGPLVGVGADSREGDVSTPLITDLDLTDGVGLVGKGRRGVYDNGLGLC